MTRQTAYIEPGSTVASVRLGTLVSLKLDGPTWVREGYDRETKRFELASYDDVGRSIMAKGSRQIFECSR